MIASGVKRGTAELAVLSVLESGALHGYEIARRIEQQTKGSLRFSLGNWETGANRRRRRCYHLTPAGKKKLAPLRSEWSALFAALHRLARVSNA